MSIQNAYNEWSDTYDTDQNLTRDLDQKVTREALTNLHFESILEIGCGTGKNTTFLAQVGTRVHAMDFSEGVTEIPAFVHHISDFVNEASRPGLKLLKLNEYWHEQDQGKPPRIVSCVF